MSGQTRGGHTPEPKRVRTCVLLCKRPCFCPGLNRGANLACPCPTHLASLAAATVTQGSSSHQTGLRGEVSQFSLDG